MSRKTVSLLDHASLERVHAESLWILENLGVRVDDPGCVEVMKNAGARVHEENGVVRLPERMVDEALLQITREFELLHPTGEHFWSTGEQPKVGTRVKMPKILEYGATECRPPRREDVTNLCRITNALAAADFTCPITFPSSDVPPEIDVVDTLGLTLAVTGIMACLGPSTEDGARAELDLLAAATDCDDYERKATTWVAVNATSPLTLGAREGAIIRHVVGRHVPIDVEPMPVAGASTPFTLAGTLAVANAETLFLCTLANAIWPGAKVIHSTCGSSMNMRAANLSMGGPETCLLSSAELALAHFYGLPTYRMGGYTDSYYPDVQAGAEKMAATLTLLLSGADLITMGGPLDHAGHLSYEQVVIDHDIWEYASRCVREIEVSDETLARDALQRVAHGGSFLDDDHTYQWLRSGEHYYGGSFARSGVPSQEESMLTKAHERVNDILAQPETFAAPPAMVERIKEFVRDYARHAGVAAPEWTI
jgi:trimethylamine--corrinoid protein Co-methyltransferase